MTTIHRYTKVSGGDGCSDVMVVRPDGRWIRAQDYDTLNEKFIALQRKIEKVEEALVIPAGVPRYTMGKGE